jgi:uncharacterized SAM-binding protein YcdF (DUF218 family)
MTSTLNSITSQIVLLPTFLILIMVVAGLLIAARLRRFGWALLIASIIALAVLSTPITAHHMMQSLETHAPIHPTNLTNLTNLTTVQAIVVLGGGINPSQPEFASDMTNSGTLMRLRYAAFLNREHDLPILVSGGDPSGGEPEAWVMKRELETLFEVPVRWVEPKSMNTAENARFSREILQAAGVDTIALVTHAWHMRRAAWAFEQAGFTVVPAPTVFHVESVKGIMNFIPQASYLSMANTAVREWIGMLWYQQFARRN